MARAQGSVPLKTVVTDQTPLNLSNQFGVPSAQTVDSAGNFAFIGDGNSALFYRAVAAPSATRLLQIGDQVPGIQSSQIVLFSPLIFASQAGVLFGVSFDLPDGAPHQAVLAWNNGTYATVATDTTIAPGTVLPYGANFSPVGINDHGDIAFTAVPTTGQTLFILPAGGTVQRIVGVGDALPLPLLSGTFTSVSVIYGVTVGRTG
jgi:hypothetical protein